MLWNCLAIQGWCSTKKLYNLIMGCSWTTWIYISVRFIKHISLHLDIFGRHYTRFARLSEDNNRRVQVYINIPIPNCYVCAILDDVILVCKCWIQLGTKHKQFWRTSWLSLCYLFHSKLHHNLFLVHQFSDDAELSFETS